MTPNGFQIDQAKRALPRTESMLTCPVCEHHDSVEELFSSHDAYCGVPGVFAYVRCKECRSVFQSPRVIEEDLHLCYPESYYTHDSPVQDGDDRRDPQHSEPPPGSSPGPALRRRLAESVFRHANRQPSSSEDRFIEVLGRLGSHWPSLRRKALAGMFDELRFTGAAGDRCLEVGFGQANHLRGLARLGWTAYGIDIDPTVVSNARRFRELNVRIGTLVANDLPDDHFQLVFLHHVLEHLSPLREHLGAARRILRKNGRFVAVYPNPSSLGTFVYGPDSPNWDPPRHLVLPSTSGMAKLLRSLSFRDVRVETRAEWAEGFSVVARSYRRHRGQVVGWANDEWTRADRLIGHSERALVRLGFPLGEEIVVSASAGG
jgi:SAM-dependent methyltransferase